jgi:hypothetical protein
MLLESLGAAREAHRHAQHWGHPDGPVKITVALVPGRQVAGFALQGLGMPGAELHVLHFRHVLPI